MTSLATIADASTIADDWRGWAFVAAACVIGAAVAVILTLVATPHGVPVMGDELSNLDRLDRATTTCYRGHFYRLNPARTHYHCTQCEHTVNRAGGEL